MSPPEETIVPLLSICVPTFNRASNLRNLIRDLRAVKARFGTGVEICISNNGSTDDTAAVVEEFQAELQSKVVHQTHNIGGTLNIIAVAQLMSGHWGILVGDDDELVPDSIGSILEHLKTVDRASWLLVDAADLNGREQYFSKFQQGRYSNARFRRLLLLRCGLNPFGFMGVHIFPKSTVSILQSLKLVDAQPWPHIAALLRRLVRDEGGVQVCKLVAIMQAKGGAKLFWSGGDLARIRLAKIRILMRAYRQDHRKFLFHHLLMLRELYSPYNINSLLAWKLYEPKDFRKSAVATYLQAYSWLGLCAPLACLHGTAMLFLRVVPNSIYAGLFRLIGMGYLRSRYVALKSELGVFDGFKRGI